MDPKRSTRYAQQWKSGADAQVITNVIRLGQTMNSEDFKKGEEVIFLEGSFEGLEGSFVNVDAETGYALVHINIFGRDHPVVVPFTEISADIDLRESAHVNWTKRIIRTNGIQEKDLSRDTDGAYDNPSIAAGGFQLRLEPNGIATFHRWRDLGGTWGEIFSGFFVSTNKIVYTNLGDCEAYRDFFPSDGRLNIRTVSNRRILAPEDVIAELDNIVDTDPDWLDRLDETIIPGTSLFFEIQQ